MGGGTLAGICTVVEVSTIEAKVARLAVSAGSTVKWASFTKAIFVVLTCQALFAEADPLVREREAFVALGAGIVIFTVGAVLGTLLGYLSEKPVSR